MEDAATAEISRVQIWQWRNHSQRTQDDGLFVSTKRIQQLVQEEVQRNLCEGGKWRLAGKLVEGMLNRDKLDDFLTTVCYPHIVTIDSVSTTSRL
jgi:malate synthase